MQSTIPFDAIKDEKHPGESEGDVMQYMHRGCCENARIVSTQVLISSGHVFTEGMGKALGLPLMLSMLGAEEIVTPWGVAWLISPLVVVGVINQFNYVGRVVYDELPYYDRNRFKQHVAHGLEVQRPILAQCLTLGNIAIELTDGIAVMLAVGPSFLGMYGNLAVGFLAGSLKAYQATLIVVRRGWENMAADMALRHNRLLAPLESYVPCLNWHKEEIVHILSALTPQMFGVLHVMAAANIDIYGGMEDVFGSFLTAVFKYIFWGLLYMMATNATKEYDIRNLSLDVFGDNRLVVKYPLTRSIDSWLHSKLEMAPIDRSNFAAKAFYDQGICQVIKRPCEFLARILYGDDMFYGLSRNLTKIKTVMIAELFYGAGLFCLFYRALLAFHDEVVTLWLTDDEVTEWQDSWLSPAVVYTLVSTVGAYAQVKQKWSSFCGEWYRFRGLQSDDHAIDRQPVARPDESAEPVPRVSLCDKICGWFYGSRRPTSESTMKAGLLETKVELGSR